MKFIPHGYQRYCIQRLVTEAATALWLDMGLGKTVITLSAILDLKYNRFAVRRALVIAPKKVAEATWSLETEKWDHLRRLRVVRILGTARQRIQALHTAADVYVTNRENVAWLTEATRNAWPFDMVVLDESTSFKNHASKRFAAMARVLPHVERIVELTGTPSPNGLLDLWAQMYLLDRGERLGATFEGFRERYFVPDQRDAQRVFSYRPKPGAQEVIRRLVGDVCVSMSAKDYLDLPEVVTVDVPVSLDAKAQSQYKQLETEMLLTVEGKTLDVGSAGVLSNKLLQLCNGAVYDESRAVVEVHQAKLEAFVELVEALSGQHALVFYAYQHDADRLERALRGMHLRTRRMRTPQDAEAWNAGEVDLLLAHPASTAYGLNLQQGGHHVIWFGLTWNLELYQQANKRLHRQGQLERVVVHRLLVRGGMDEDVVAALEAKGDTQSAMLEAVKARIQAVKGALAEI